MRQFIITLLVVSALCVTACEDKEEDLVLPKKMDVTEKGEAAGADPYDPGPPRP